MTGFKLVVDGWCGGVVQYSLLLAVVGGAPMLVLSYTPCVGVVHDPFHAPWRAFFNAHQVEHPVTEGLSLANLPSIQLQVTPPSD